MRQLISVGANGCSPEEVNGEMHITASSEKQVLDFERAAALSKDGAILLDEGPRTALYSDKRVFVLKRATVL